MLNLRRRNYVVMFSVDLMSWGRELKTVGAATRNARKPKIVFILETARRLLAWQRKVWDGRYRATNELRYEIVEDKRARNASFSRPGPCRALVPDTFAASHLPATSLTVGAAAEKAASLKMNKYEDLQTTHLFVPIAIGTSGFFQQNWFRVHHWTRKSS